MLGALEASFRREHLPPPTREHPLPDPAAVTTAQTLQRLQRAIEALETAMRTAPVPEMDRIHQRHRTERDVLEKLVAVDSNLVCALVAPRDTVVRLDSAAAASQPLGTGDIRTLWNRRERVLISPEESA